MSMTCSDVAFFDQRRTKLTRPHTFLDTVRSRRLWAHLGVLRNPVSQHIEHSVGSSSPDDEFFVTSFLRIAKP